MVYYRFVPCSFHSKNIESFHSVISYIKKNKSIKQIFGLEQNNFLYLAQHNRIPVYSHFVPPSFRSKNKDLFLVWSEITSYTRTEMTVARNDRIPIQLDCLGELTG